MLKQGERFDLAKNGGHPADWVQTKRFGTGIVFGEIGIDSGHVGSAINKDAAWRMRCRRHLGEGKFSTCVEPREGRGRVK